MFFDENRVFIIAEIGKNFIQTKQEKTTEEYLDNAKKLIKAAKESGADAVKFQTHNVEDEQLNINIVSPHFSGSDRYNWVLRNDMATPYEFWKELKDYSEGIGIIFFSTPMSRGAAQKINDLVDIWKVGSGDILDFVLLDYLASTKKPIIMSTGMSTIEEIDKSVNFLKERIDKIALLHCVSKYPCPIEDLNLGTIKFLKDRYNIITGFSDHSIGYDSVVSAVNLGAKIIEKHFSFDRNLWGSDHKVSMTPDEFRKMVDSIRSIENIKSDNFPEVNKILQDDEAIFRPIFRKSLVASCDIKRGMRLSKEMIYAMRPQQYIKALPSEEYENVLGKKIIKDVSKYNPITKDILK